MYSSYLILCYLPIYFSLSFICIFISIFLFYLIYLFIIIFLLKKKFIRGFLETDSQHFLSEVRLCTFKSPQTIH